MAKRKANKQVLGVMVTSRTIHAILLETGSDGLTVLRRFMRPRTSRFSTTQTALPDLQNSEDDNDFSIQFSSGSSVENMFLGSEFGGLEVSGGETEGEQKELAATFVLELGDILAECREVGAENPMLAFCAAASEINQVELTIVREGKSKGGGEISEKERKKPGKAASRSELLEVLALQHSGSFEEETVAFLPMTLSEEGAQRYLALFPKVNDPVAATLRTLREQQGRTMPPVRLLDTEASLYLGLARATRNLVPQKPKRATDTFDEGAALDSGEGRNTLIVRAGAEDTLVLFMQDNKLQQSENLRSLTAYEAPETICSRVLLLQDEYGIGEVQHVLLLSEEREDDLVESFEMFFPDARVESLRQYVPELSQPASGEVSTGALLPAIGVGIRVIDDERYKNVFEDVNLLPKQLLRRRIQLPVTWHVLVLYVLLFCTVLFFMARYFKTESVISDHQRSIQEFQEEVGPVDMDARVLQARIDSLEAVHARYMRSLNVLEGLLQGSDKWSRALETISDEVSDVTGIWIENWNPRGASLELSGNATARDQVVNLAERLDGTIAALTFSEIREWQVYSFTVTVPLEQGLPKAAQYLREQVAAAEQEAAEGVPITSTALQGQ
ncbi:MAG: PilN domain-containing protein [Rhodothermales bacterium]